MVVWLFFYYLAQAVFFRSDAVQTLIVACTTGLLYLRTSAARLHGFFDRH